MSFSIFLNMGFRENLKAELNYSGMKVKELADLSEVKKQTIDSYFRENGYSPSVETAVSIAGALGVSMEYLVTGVETKQTRIFSQDLRLLLQALEQLHARDQKIVIKTRLI